MKDLVPTSGLSQRLPARGGRAASQAVAQVRGHQAVQAAQETARVAVIADVTEAALLAASHISALETFLMDRTPHAEGRLKRIADAGALGLSSVVYQATSRCR